jgi:hypothetical protein
MLFQPTGVDLKDLIRFSVMPATANSLSMVSMSQSQDLSGITEHVSLQPGVHSGKILPNNVLDADAMSSSISAMD